MQSLSKHSLKTSSMKMRPSNKGSLLSDFIFFRLDGSLLWQRSTVFRSNKNREHTNHFFLRRCYPIIADSSGYGVLPRAAPKWHETKRTLDRIFEEKDGLPFFASHSLPLCIACARTRRVPFVVFLIGWSIASGHREPHSDYAPTDIAGEPITTTTTTITTAK